jgi:hypothetical protein
VSDVSALGGLHSLNLTRTKVKDVSALGNVFRLRLDWTEVEDISALGLCNELFLAHCDKITNFAAIGTVRVFDRNLHSRMALVLTPVCLTRERVCSVPCISSVFTPLAG